MKIPMNANLKYLGLLAVLPLLTVALTTDYSSEADAITKGAGVGVKQFGSATKSKVCGDRLCSEPARGATPAFDIEEDDRVEFISQHDEDTPTAKLISIQKLRESTNKADAITHIITFSVTAGQTNLENIRIHVSSDIGSSDFNIESLQALKSSVNVIRIKALDADSIDGGITGYTLSPPTFDARNPNR